MKEKAVASSGCCGGAPLKDETACCLLDEEKKSEGETGCDVILPKQSRQHHLVVNELSLE